MLLEWLALNWEIFYIIFKKWQDKDENQWTVQHYLPILILLKQKSVKLCTNQ